MIKAIVQTLVGFLAPIYMIFLLPFINKDGNLPKWAQWAQTMDCPFPGGLYEPTMKTIYDKFGFYTASYYWAGWRNRAHGLAYIWGKPAVDYIPNPFSTDRDRSGWHNLFFWRKDDDVWQQWVRAPLLSFLLRKDVYEVDGFEVWKLQDGTFRAGHILTLKVN